VHTSVCPYPSPFSGRPGALRHPQALVQLAAGQWYLKQRADLFAKVLVLWLHARVLRTRTMPGLPFNGDLVGERLAFDMRPGGEGIYLEVRDSIAALPKPVVTVPVVTRPEIMSHPSICLHCERITPSKKRCELAPQGASILYVEMLHVWT
jgi:hypothetical protein